MSVDANDQFRASCNRSGIYPANLLRARHAAYTLQSLAENLTQREDKLFDTDNALLDILELSDGMRRKSRHEPMDLRRSVRRGIDIDVSPQ